MFGHFAGLTLKGLTHDYIGDSVFNESRNQNSVKVKPTKKRYVAKIFTSRFARIQNTYSKGGLKKLLGVLFSLP